MSAERGISGIRSVSRNVMSSDEEKFTYSDNRHSKKDTSVGDFSAFNIMSDRAQTADHVDVHVFLLPKKDWQNDLNLAFNDAVSSAISLGFLRVNRNVTLVELSLLIKEKCTAPLPKEFAFIKSVGRAYAMVKDEQMQELKVKHFFTPNSFTSEVFLMDSPQSGEVYEELTSSDDQLQDKLDETRNKRLEMEAMREEMIKYLKQLHNKITLARKESRVIWKRNYFAEKKKQPKDKETMKINVGLIENWQEKIYQQLAIAKVGSTEHPQTRENALAYLKLKDSLFLYNRKLEEAKVKLATDVKLRNQAESERTNLRKELVNTRININQLKKILV